jgi:enoyl-CoA hydratase
VLDTLQRSGQSRALVISSTGKHLCAGMALETFADPAFAPNDRTPEAAPPSSHPGPAAVHLQQDRSPAHARDLRHSGRLRGWRLDLVATACIRYASAESFFCVQEINIGMTADLGSLQRLPKLMPLGIVKELAYTGRRMTAQEAASHGLVNAV